MYYSRHTVGTLTGIVLLAVLFLGSALFLLTHQSIVSPVEYTYATPTTTLPVIETAEAFTTTPVVVEGAPVRVTQIATSTEKKVPTISKAPVEKKSKPVILQEEAAVVKSVPAPVKEQPRALRFDALTMLNAHNKVRVALGLTPLTWSNTLAQSSRKWGDLLIKGGCDFYHDPDTPYGENLFWQWISQSSNNGLISTPRDAVTWWADEVAYYNYTKNTCRRGEDCGHYTQIVWADTTEVGCSVHTCFEPKKDDLQTDLWVCRYNPPGNIEGMRPY